MGPHLVLTRLRGAFVAKGHTSHSISCFVLNLFRLELNDSRIGIKKGSNVVVSGWLGTPRYLVASSAQRSSQGLPQRRLLIPTRGGDQ